MYACALGRPNDGIRLNRNYPRTRIAFIASHNCDCRCPGIQDTRSIWEYSCAKPPRSWSTQIIDSLPQIIDPLPESALDITVVRNRAFDVARVATPQCSIMRHGVVFPTLCRILLRDMGFFAELQRSAPFPAIPAWYRAAFCATVMQHYALLSCSVLPRCHAAFRATVMKYCASPRRRRRPAAFGIPLAWRIGSHNVYVAVDNSIASAALAHGL